MNQHRFARVMIQALRHAGLTDPIQYDADRFQLHISFQLHGLKPFSLDNVFRRYQEVPYHARTSVLQEYAQALIVFSRPSEEQSDPASLYPRLASPATLKEGESHRIIGTDLAFRLVYVCPNFVKPARQSEGRICGLTVADAFEVAIGNLRRQSERYLASPSRGVYMSAYGDNLDASRLLLTEIVRDCEVRGDPVAMVPNRDKLIITGADDEAGLTAMIGLAEPAFRGPYSISGKVFRLRGQEWLPFQVPAHHPAFDRFRVLELESNANDYASQSDRLRQQEIQSGRNYFVAEYFPGSPTALWGLNSGCTWTEGVPALLPRTDYVAFVRVDRDLSGKVCILAAASWDRVEEVVGGLMTPQGLHPERYRVQSFPTPDQLAALGFAHRR